MRRVIVALGVFLPLCFAGGGTSVALPSPAAGPPAPFVSGQVLVRFAADARQSERGAILDSVGSEGSRALPVPGLRLVDLPPKGRVGSAAAKLEADPGVLYAEPNYIDAPEDAPNDVGFGLQWGLSNSGQTITGITGITDADIDAPEAWSRASGSPNVIVGIMDTGVLLTHQDLDGNLWSNPGEVVNGIDDDGNGYVDDVHGYDFNGAGDPNPNPGSDDHGTHVAGIAGAEGNNVVGISGVTQDVQLAALKTTNDTGGGTPVSDFIEAIAYASHEGMTVANASFGSLRAPTQAERDALTAASNTLFVFSAGNDGINTDTASPTHYPSGYRDLPNVISVAATNSDDSRRSTSNYGAATVDLGAPGSNIVSTVSASTTSYGYKSGTSMAAPVVTGAAALLKGVAPGAPADALKRRILATVDPTLPGIVGSGGRLNLDRLTMPPNTSITGRIHNRGVGRGRTQTLSFSADQAEVQFECSVDGDAYGACSSGGSDTRDYSFGRHALQVRAGFYGLLDPSAATVTFWVDPPNGPHARIRSGPRGKVRGRVAKFRLAASPHNPPGLRFRCKIDRRPFRACRARATYRRLRPGRHLLRVFAIDASGPGPVIKRSWRILRR